MKADERLLSILKDWKNRYKKYACNNDAYSLGYRDALAECKKDMENEISAEVTEKKYSDLEDFLTGLDADEYLSSMEANGFPY